MLLINQYRSPPPGGVRRPQPSTPNPRPHFRFRGSAVEHLAIYYRYLFHGLDYMHINVGGWEDGTILRRVDRYL